MQEITEHDPLSGIKMIKVVDGDKLLSVTIVSGSCPGYFHVENDAELKLLEERHKARLIVTERTI